MTYPNPFYIDSEARHPASVLRVLAWAATEGKEGILHPSALAPRAFTTPGAGLTLDPGPFAVNCKHQGGQFESYIAKLPLADTVELSPVGSAGPRTDLIVARIENPYVDESTSWNQPPDVLNGPYWAPLAVEGVPATINHVNQHNAGWSAIPVCKVTRPANTGIVLQSHITDLRSLARLGGDRIIIPPAENPPVGAPPIANEFWSESTPVGNNSQLTSANTGWTDFPAGVTWKVPVPAWATGMDVMGWFNPEILTNWAIGETRLVINGDPTNAIPVGFNINFPGQRVRETLMIGGTESIGSNYRGKEVTMKLQARHMGGGGGTLRCGDGTRVNLLLNFKRNPSYEVFD